MDVDVIVMIVINIVPHKKKTNCIHEWNHITQKKRPITPVPLEATMSSDDGKVMNKIKLI